MSTSSFDIIADLWDAAERDIARADQVASGISIPAVNELRFAGRHLVTAAAAQTDKLQAESLDKAKAHCLRARHEALELAAIAIATSISHYQKLAGNPSTSEQVAALNSTITPVMKVFLERRGPSRADLTDETVELLDKAISIHVKLIPALAQAEAEQLQANRLGKIIRWLSAAGFAVAAGAASSSLLQSIQALPPARVVGAWLVKLVGL